MGCEHSACAEAELGQPCVTRDSPGRICLRLLPSHVLPSPCLCHRGQKTAARLSSSNEDLGDPCEDALAFSQGGPSHKIAALCFDDRHAQTSRSTPNLTVFAKLPYVPSMNCQRCENGHTARRGAVNRAWSIAATRLQSRAIDERAGACLLMWSAHLCAKSRSQHILLSPPSSPLRGAGARGIVASGQSCRKS